MDGFDEAVVEVPARPQLDVTLIDEMLQLNPLQRLKLNDRLVAEILAFRQAYEHRDDGER